MESTYSKIENILNEHFFIKPAHGIERQSFIKELGFNSLEFVELVVYIENIFNIQLPDNELNKIGTLRQMADCVERNMVFQIK